MATIMAVDGRVYGAYGYRVAATVDIARTGYAGEVGEADLPWYLLGERFYVTWLRRFASADRASPFDEGGLNRYAFCAGDPLNRIDPSGRSWLDWLFTGIALVGAVVGTIATGGVLAGVLGGTIAATVATTVTLAASTVLSVASIGIEIAGAVARESGDMKLAATLGWVGLGVGMASAALEGLGALGTRAAQFVGAGALVARSTAPVRATVAKAATNTTRTVAVATRVAGSGAKLAESGARATSSPLKAAWNAVIRHLPVATEALRHNLRPISGVLRGPAQAGELASRQLGSAARRVGLGANIVGSVGAMASGAFMRPEGMGEAPLDYAVPSPITYAPRVEEVLPPFMSEDEWLRRRSAGQDSSVLSVPGYSSYALAAVDNALMSGLNMAEGVSRPADGI